MQYTKESLEKLYKTNYTKITRGENLSRYDELLTVAAGYAIDLLNASSRLNKGPLDLTMETYENIKEALAIYGMAATMGEYDPDAELDKLIKLAASYEMFMFCNALNDVGKNAKIVLPIYGDELILEAKNKRSGITKTINFYDAYRRTQTKNNLFQFFDDYFVIDPRLAAEIESTEFMDHLLGCEAED